MTAISLAPGLIEVTVFGGSPLFVPKQHASEAQSIAASTVLTFGEFSKSHVVIIQYIIVRHC